MCLLRRDVDDVHNLMDDVAEQQEIANEISEAISNPVGFGQDVDEVRIISSTLFIDLNYFSAQDDLMAELEELEQESLDEQLLEVQPVPDNLPAVPQKEPQRPGKYLYEITAKVFRLYSLLFINNIL